VRFFLDNVATKLFSKAALVLIVKITIAILGFVFHYLLARQLPVAEFGLFTVVLTIVMFSSAFAKQGLEQVIVRTVAHNTQYSVFALYCYTLIKSLFYASLIGLFFWFFSASIAQELFQKPQLQPVLLFVAALTIIQSWLALNSAVLKGKEHAVASTFFTGGATFLIAIFLLIIMPVESAYDGLFTFLSAATAACCLSQVVTLTKIKLHRFSAHQLSRNRVYDQASKHFFVISIAALITQQFSTLVLTRYASLEQIAAYGIALKIALLATYPLIALNAVTAPKYAQLYKAKDYVSFKKLGQSTGKALLLISTAIIAVLAYTSQYLVMLLGEGYQLAIPLVLILLSGQWVNLATGSAVSMLAMAGFEKLHKRNTLILVSVNILALLVFVPVYGVYGAAIITSVMIATKNLIALYFVHKLIYQPHAKD
tara:strand:- start:18662 stop:19939 length:1278 start_codon:yes stop_codon:yes gene_type:complete